jgi:small subunit ribosomal protein S3
MEAGALGCEIVISGKLRTERARFEKFRAGYFPRCGEPALKYTRKTEAHVQLKAGMFGVRVKIMPPDAQFPDKIKILNELPPELAEKPAPEAPAPQAEAPEVEVAAEEPQPQPAQAAPPQEPAQQAPSTPAAEQTPATEASKPEEAKPEEEKQ